MEFTTTVLAAVLTIIGYSINATVVILDRIRYNLTYMNDVKTFTPILLKDLQDASGKIPPRRVDIDGGIAQNYYKNICHYITPEDYEAAKAYVPDPENYDFKKILNWD